MSKGAPEQIEPRRLGDYLEVMSKAVFQSGMSWAVIDKKWPGIRDAFRDFEPLVVASLTEAQIADLTSDTRIIRNRKKVEAIVDNARRMIDLDEQHKGFRKYLRSHGGFEDTVADLRKQFRFLGETGCYYFLWVVKEEVPEYDTWCASRGIVHTPVHVS
jgi:3-methyladenine DNA glycosylase Tag